MTNEIQLNKETGLVNQAFIDKITELERLMLESDNPKFTNIVGISVIKKVSTIPGYDEYVVNIDFGVLTP